MMTALQTTGNQVGGQPYTFCVADFMLRIVFCDANDGNSIRLLPSFAPFMADNNDGTDGTQLLFTLSVTDAIDDGGTTERIGCFETGNGDIIVHRTISDGYHYQIKNTFGNVCCALVSDSTFERAQCVLFGDDAMRSFGLNNALMIMFAFASVPYDTLLMHASCVVADGKAYPFIAQSGTGKSTHSSLWLKNIANTHLLNDDNPILRIVNGTVMMYGSPWSGKTPCYRQEKFPVGAIVRICRAPANSIERLSVVHAFAAILPSCSTMKTDGRLHGTLCQTIGKVISRISVYAMHCLPNNEAAFICHSQASQS